jgi:hypothetical protein
MDFRKSVGKIQGSLKSDKNNGHFTWRQVNLLWDLAEILE